MILPLTALVVALVFPIPKDQVAPLLSDRQGGLVMIDTQSGQVQRYHAPACAEPLPPCSTFKIWNTAIGFELGELRSPDEPFWKWDGVKRSHPEWNQDLDLRDAFAVSCVPAFQALARKTGKARMQAWLDKLGYGDRDISAGEDVFWLAAKGRKTILISANEQAELINRLVTRHLPLTAKTQAALKVIMQVKKTPRGTLYGKTGTGPMGAVNVAWFVGYVETAGRTFAFACVEKKADLSGPDVRDQLESFLEKQGYL